MTTTQFTPRWRLVAGAALFVGATALTGCTSSGSDASPSTAAPTGSTAQSGSNTQSGSAGPTAPLSGTASVAQANPLVYSPVTKKQNTKLQKIVRRAPGVQNLAYYPDTKQVQVFLAKSITLKERKVVDLAVTQVLHPANVPTPSKSKHGN